jgi:hypothetical protein
MKPSSALSTLFGVAFFAAVAYGIYRAVGFGAGLFDGVGREATVITAAAALTLLVCASIVAGGLRAVAGREELRQRAAAYEGILRLHADGVVDSYHDGRGYPAAPDPAADQALLLHAPPAVLNAYLRLRRAEEAGGHAREERAHLVRAMRRDLGHRGADLRADELVELLRSPARERV